MTAKKRILLGGKVRWHESRLGPWALHSKSYSKTSHITLMVVAMLFISSNVILEYSFDVREIELKANVEIPKSELIQLNEAIGCGCDGILLVDRIRTACPTNATVNADFCQELDFNEESQKVFEIYRERKAAVLRSFREEKAMSSRIDDGIINFEETWPGEGFGVVEEYAPWLRTTLKPLGYLTTRKFRTERLEMSKGNYVRGYGMEEFTVSRRVFVYGSGSLRSSSVQKRYTDLTGSVLRKTDELIDGEDDYSTILRVEGAVCKVNGFKFYESYCLMTHHDGFSVHTPYLSPSGNSTDGLSWRYRLIGISSARAHFKINLTPSEESLISAMSDGHLAGYDTSEEDGDIVNKSDEELMARIVSYSVYSGVPVKGNKKVRVVTTRTEIQPVMLFMGLGAIGIFITLSCASLIVLSCIWLRSKDLQEGWSQLKLDDTTQYLTDLWFDDINNLGHCNDPEDRNTGIGLINEGKGTYHLTNLGEGTVYDGGNINGRVVDAGPNVQYE